MYKLIGTICTAALLAACAGGGSTNRTSASPPLTRPTNIAVALAQRPAETLQTAGTRAANLRPRVDSLYASSLYGRVWTSPPMESSFSPTCRGDTCTWANATTGETVSLQARELMTPTPNARMVLTKNGITTGEGGFENYRRYGAWMNHAAFAVEALRQRLEVEGRPYVTMVTAGTAGDLTRSRPTGSATWRGLMVGSPSSGPTIGNPLQGDALLTYRLATASLDADFTNIVDLSRGRAHTVQNIRFANVSVTAQGTFLDGHVGNYIWGGFYGPGHAEVAGTFEKSGIVGAFGARR